jgi:hypothetical protein
MKLTLIQYYSKYGVVLLVLLLTACSFKTFYNNLDIFIPEYVEGLVTLDDALEQTVDHRTEMLLHWHRSTQLDQYADWFKSLQTSIQPTVADDQILQHFQQAEIFWEQLVTRINGEMAAVLPLLSLEQQKELFASLEHKNKEFASEYINIDDDERIEGYRERIYDTYENWFGDLTGQQETLINQVAIQFKSSAKRRLALRKQWQQNISEIISSDESYEVKSALLTQYFKQNNINDDAELSSTFNYNRSLLVKLTVDIIHTLEHEQKQYFFEKTNDYIRMFTELVNEV